jgi:hypothetical protein
MLRKASKFNKINKIEKQHFRNNDKLKTILYKNKET